LPLRHSLATHQKEFSETLQPGFRELFDFAPIAYFAFNAAGNVERLNIAAAKLLGLDRASVAGQPAALLFAGEHREQFRVHLARVMQEGGNHAIDLVLAGGASVHVVSRRLDSEAGHRPFCLSTVFDITDRKNAEAVASQLNVALQQRVAQRTLELEESNRDMEAFVYSISHDLRAPLRNMAGFATIITEDYRTQIPPDVAGYVARIAAGNEKLLHLVDDLLKFSRLGRKPLEVADTDLNELLDEALSDFSSEMRGRDIQWHRARLPIAKCDRGLMRQVFVNLLSNALKYSRPRRPAIIKVRCENRGTERVIVIEDNGVGFDMRYIDKLFSVFQRLHLPTEFEGNGVGLAIVSRILQRHGGRAHAEGRVGQGAKFWFTFEGLRNAT
jgi:PAS domain S-box-containing protein